MMHSRHQEATKILGQRNKDLENPSSVSFQIRKTGFKAITRNIN